ncbi:MAG: NAD(P)/FAD-dependent oxidoreductase [Fibrobacter sp.]|nr:NAD(P)/FAD-dependent oxidoreductase [Fibrobacter sp.]
MNSSFDAVVIGSGLGGLCCGALLANAGMKVLVLEQHTKIGGYAHNFKRRQFTFESGIHSVPMAPDGVMMHILKLLNIDSKISVIEQPSMYSVNTPDGHFSIPSRADEIDEFFKKNSATSSDLKALKSDLDKFYNKICVPIFTSGNKYIPEDSNFISQFHNRSYLQHISSLCKTPAVSNLIFGQWPYSGISEDEAGALFSFTMFMIHYKEGSHFCKGGFSSLAKALADKIIEKGGNVLTRKIVNQCIVENNRITRIATTDGSVYETRIAVSNISPYKLHSTLLMPQFQGKLLNRRLKNLTSSVSCVIVYLGMNPAFKSYFSDNISFWYNTSDFSTIYRNIITNKPKDQIDHLVTLCGVDEGNHPTLTLMNFTQKNYSSSWNSEKMIIAEKMLHKLEKLHPEINKYIELMEVGSPETFERYTGNTDGALYGFENIKTMYGEAKLPITTHIPNLFQTGHWGKPGGGVWNVMVNALNTSKLIFNSIH